MLNGNLAKRTRTKKLVVKKTYHMIKNKKSPEAANLCSMSFLKVLKSRIKKADTTATNNYSESKLSGLDAFGPKFRAITS